MKKQWFLNGVDKVVKFTINDHLAEYHKAVNELKDVTNDKDTL